LNSEQLQVLLNQSNFPAYQLSQIQDLFSAQASYQAAQADPQLRSGSFGRFARPTFPATSLPWFVPFVAGWVGLV
jgi:hypothetical protein